MKSLVKIREYVSRWIMRTKNAGRVLRIPLLGVTAVSTMVTALKGTSFENYTAGIVAVSAVAGFAFIWAYDRFQVMNIESRWNADRSDNYYGPTGAINQLVSAERQAVLAHAIKNDWEMDKTRKEMINATERAVSKFRDGIDMNKFEEGGLN